MLSSNNIRIVEIFKRMSFLLELEGGNPFKIRAYQNAMRIISSLDKDITEFSDDELLSIKGIGKGIIQHIKDILKNGSFDEYDMLLKKYPISIFELFEIPGLGGKRIKSLYEKLSIDSKEKLYKAAKNGDISKLDGFGPKIEQGIIEAIEKGINQQKRFLISEALKTATDIVAYIKNLGYRKVEIAGSLRRGKETIGDIDILVVGDESFSQKVIKYPFIEKVLAKGSTKVSVLLKNSIQCDIRNVEEDSFGSALCYFTGSKEHNIALREIAIKRGYILSEYGLFRKDDNKKVAGRTEQEIYEKLGLQYIPPELRENNGEIELAMVGKIPKLVELKDIRGDIHSHTDLTDGSASLYDIVKFLSDKYEWFFIGDHSAPLNFVHGLDFNSYNRSREDLLKLKTDFPKVDFDRSIELEILKDGNLAFSSEELENVALVIAAAHTSTRMKKDEMTKRILKALANPYCDVVAHLTQRLIFQRDEVEMDYDLIFEEARKYNSVFEINGQPDRLDLKDVYVKKVKELGLKVILSSDAHSLDQFSYIEYALKNARRAGLTKDDVLNTYTYRELIEFFKENRRRRKKYEDPSG